MFTSFRFGVLEFGGWEGEWGDLGYKTLHNVYLMKNIHHSLHVRKQIKVNYSCQISSVLYPRSPHSPSHPPNSKTPNLNEVNIL
jgi:hypothetical protein